MEVAALKAVRARHGAGLRDTAAQVKRVGRSAIIVASEVLAGPEGEGRA